MIERAIRDREYEKRLPSILEARRRVLDQYNMLAVLTHEIEPRTGGGNLRCVGRRDSVPPAGVNPSE